MQNIVKPLKRYDTGIKMGVSSIEKVINHISDKKRGKRSRSKDERRQLQNKIQVLTDKHHGNGKEPTPLAKRLSWLRSNIKLELSGTDKTVADRMTDGCSMGISKFPSDT